jgi:hypothetical protein
MGQVGPCHVLIFWVSWIHHTPPLYVLKKVFITIIQTLPRSSKSSPSPRLLHNTVYRLRLARIHSTCSAHHIFLNLVIRKIFAEEYRTWTILLCIILRSRVPSSLLVPNINRSPIFSNTFSLLSLIIVTDQVSHTFKATGKSTIVCILIVIFLVSQLEDWIFWPE